MTDWRASGTCASRAILAVGYERVVYSVSPAVGSIPHVVVKRCILQQIRQDPSGTPLLLFVRLEQTECSRRHPLACGGPRLCARFYPLGFAQGPNGTPGIFQIAGMGCQGPCISRQLLTCIGVSDINLDLGLLGPSSRESTGLSSG